MTKKFTLPSGGIISLFAVSHYSNNSKFPLAQFSFHAPVLTEHWIIQNDFLQQFNELIGKICSHEGLHSDRHFLGVLGLWQRSLDNLQAEPRHGQMSDIRFCKSS